MPTSSPPARLRRRPALVMMIAALALSITIPAIAISDASGPGNGVLKVSTSPEVPALITVDGVPRNTGSVGSLELPAGDHQVCFGAVEGYITPTCETATIAEGSTTSLVGEFAEAGTLTANVDPQGLQPAVSVNDVERDRAPVSLDLPAGQHEICFEDLAGYETVDCQTVDVRAGQEASVTASYEPIDGENSRVTRGLVSLYDFSDGSGDTVRDITGTDGMDLSIQDTSAVTWTDGALTFESSTLAATDGAATSFYDTVSDSQEFTAEAWVTPANASQTGPARLVTSAASTTATNFLLGQGEYGASGDLVEGRLHEREGDYALRTASGTLGTGLTHVAMTRSDAGDVSIYIDGELTAQREMADTLDGWDESFRLGIGNEMTGDRAWLGTYHLVALYGTALDAREVQQNFAAGPQTDGRVHDPAPAPEPDAPEDDPEPAPSPSPGETGTTSQLSQHGITWTFDRDYTYGTYANGDYWVQGPVTIEKIDPPSTSGGRTMNGSMINPSPRQGSTVGYDSDIRDVRYSADHNVALNVSRSNPLRVPENSSLVSTKSVAAANNRPGVNTAAVLTVVDSPPPANSFRPPYSGNDKTARFTTDDLRYDLLPRLDRVRGTSDIDRMADNFQRVWLDHVPDWAGRSIHPVTSMPHYGRDLASRYGEGSLMLMLDFSNAQKERLLINQVQIGIDMYGLVEDGGERNWVPNGGHAQGRKWPILFAGTVLDDPAMAGIGQRNDVMFGEDAQTFYVSQRDIDRGVGYTSQHRGMAEWGIRHATDPSRDSPSWGASYRQCCTANSWGGHVLSARIMGLKDAWNHDPLFDYTDRFIEEQAPNDAFRFWDRPFTENMWDTYRPQF